MHLTTGEKFFPSHVQHVEVDYVDTDTCTSIMRDISPSLSIIDAEMCAGPTSHSEDDKGVCNGDSGGPLFDKNNDALVGVTSW